MRAAVLAVPGAVSAGTIEPTAVSSTVIKTTSNAVIARCRRRRGLRRARCGTWPDF
jgi:hypothetical protein